MMLRTVLLSGCVVLFASALSWGHELNPIGTLPELHADWEISGGDRQSKEEASLPFHWVVFRHKKTDDWLSFAALPPETGPRRGLEFWSDTALEIFPSGRPVWNQKGSDATITVLNIGASKGKEVLEFCFVTESSARENLMAHGRVWVCKKGIVFVQHTSARPMTPDVVEETVASLIRVQQEDRAPASP